MAFLETPFAPGGRDTTIPLPAAPHPRLRSRLRFCQLFGRQSVTVSNLDVTCGDRYPFRPRLESGASARGPLLAAAAIAGALASPWISPPPPLARWVALGCVTFAGVLLSTAAARNGATQAGVRVGCWVVVVATLVLSRGGSSPEVHLKKPTLTVVTTWVDSVPTAIRLPREENRERPEGFRTTFRTRAPDLSVTVEGDTRSLRPGYHIELSGLLIPRRTFANPGGRSSSRPQAAILAVPAPQLVRVINDNPFSCGWLDGIVFTIRHNVDRTVRQLYGVEFHGNMLALLLGDRRNLDAEFVRALETTGTLHFIAISGLHAGILLAFVLRMPLGRWGSAAKITFVVLFALVTGAAPPILRTSLMVVLGAVAGLCGRALRPIDGLSWAVVALLFHRPDLIFDRGFQLSAAAVFSIIEWSPRIRAALTPRRHWSVKLIGPSHRARPTNGLSGGLRAIASFLAFSLEMISASIAVSLAASLGTAPILLYHFQRLHPLAPIWNLVLFPCVAIGLTCGFASVLTGWCHPFLGIPFTLAAEVGLDSLSWLVQTLAVVPGSCVYLSRPPLWIVLGASTLLFVGQSSLFRRLLSPRTQRRRHSIALAMAIVLAGSIGYALLRSERLPLLGPRVLFLDVGAGSATLIVCPDGATILIDAGSNDSRHTIGKRLSQSVLSLGIQHLDALVLTHKDADHVNGVDTIADTLSIGSVWVSPFFERSPAGLAIVRRLRARGLPVSTISRGDRLAPRRQDEIVAPGRQSEWTLDVLHPAHDESLPLVTSSNDTSLVLCLSVRTATKEEKATSRILLTADIEEHGTARLLSYGQDLAAEILVAPHHGGKNSLFDLLLDHVRPEWCVVSANDRGHAPRIISTLTARGIQPHATWRNGAAVATFDGVQWSVGAPFR